MKYIGWLIIAAGLALIGRGWIEESTMLAVCGVFVIYCGSKVTTWTIRDIGAERIVIEPSPVPGFNAYFEQRWMNKWSRDLDITGWGATQAEAEASVLERVKEYKDNQRRLESTPTKVVDL